MGYQFCGNGGIIIMSWMRTIACLLIGIMFVEDVAWAATATRNAVSVMNAGTSVAARTANSVIPEKCEQQFFGCMDTFCIMDNTSGGRCTCSDDGTKFDAEFANIKNEINTLNTKARATVNAIETATAVEKTQANTTPQKKSRVSLDIFYQTDDDDEAEAEVLIGDLTGHKKFDAAYDLCAERMDADCAGSMEMLTLLYNQSIKSDCLAYQNAIRDQRNKLTTARVDARSQIQTAALDAYRAANKYDLGQCIIEYTKCFQTDAECGNDWAGCIKTQYETTAEIFERKRPICERVLDSCTDVRDQVFPAFYASIKNDLLIAELHQESDFRQNCLDTVTTCITRSCQEDIAGTGQATMDACLAYPDIAYSYCKREIEECQLVMTDIWDQAQFKLAGMRQDACTREVRDCLTADTACGADFSNCLGLDMNALHKICPLEKLVVCRQGNKDFTVDDFDEMAYSIYMNIDNSYADFCQQRAQDMMIEVCGDLNSCNVFADQSYLGANSLAYQKMGSQHILSGLINFSGLELSGGDEWAACMRDNQRDCSAFPNAGKIDIEKYMSLAEIAPNNTNYGDMAGGLERIRAELETMQQAIDGKIAMYESDPQLRMCMYGRDLSQITGQDETTQARYPFVGNPYKLAIAQNALQVFQSNYNLAVTAYTQQASKDAAASHREAMCLQLPQLLEAGKDPEDDRGGVSGASGAYSVARVLGRSLSNDDRNSLADKKHEIKKDEMLTRTVWAAWSAGDGICHIYGVDKYCGKESQVSKRMEIDKEYDDNYKKNLRTNMAIATAPGMAGVGAAGAIVVSEVTAAVVEAGIEGVILTGAAKLSVALAAVPVWGWAAAAAVMIGATLAAIFTGKKDPYVCRENEWHTETPLGDY